MRLQYARRENRLFGRVEVVLNAVLREYGSAQRFTVDVKDLSLAGLRFETSFTLVPEAAISIRIPTLSPLDATIIWRSGFRYGCAFRQPLHVAVFDHFAARYQKAETGLIAVR